MAPKKILIVDDDKEYLEELSEMLTLAGYDVTAISDGASAVKAAQVTMPDIILMDLRMPIMSGFEVADRLKVLTQTCKIPVIAITGYYTMKEHVWLMKFCGIKRCIKKPVNPIDIKAEIESVLKEQEASG
ncbi:MAG: response regulator [Candidatus Omnitrophica bacterium]|nr:response regulator [Candidatus Omnitrophota bacterium]MBU0881094.1 response regulator [Candidatus Omnitrophota bacterium]MBU0895027.1 response regulator [Candidatus Omnitrophota bacterium]MBU1038273.1 response regulator [Candidatus Omnitrophota bacterium]MBU1808496.1 response regulator [Candidatus Omnitrophota bacterium]